MKKNMGTSDKTVRLIVAAVFLILFFTNVISGLLAYILLGLSGIFILTSLISFCPLYTLFGIKTNSTEQRDSKLS